MYMTGLRIGDIFNIKEGGIYLEKQETGEDILKLNVVTKGNKKRIVWIWDKETINLICNFISNTNYKTGYIFMEKGNNKLLKNNYSKKYLLKNKNYFLFWEHLKIALNSSNIDTERFAPHSFRRLYAKRVYEKYKDIDLLKRMMGHADVSTSLRYIVHHGLDIKETYKELQL